MKRGRAAAVVLIVLCGVMALTAISSAHRKFYKSAVTISLAKAPGADTASGKVKAHRKACRKGRTVILYQEDKPGNTGKFLEIGRTKTDGAGNWSVAIPNEIKKGRAYHAQTKAKRVRNRGGHRHICRPRYSPDVIG